MRTQVTFRHPAPLVSLSAEDNILSTDGAGWFLVLLQSMPGWTTDPHLCQEDWGVVFFVTRGKKKFWIGLGDLPEVGWLAHVHHGSFAWLQKFTATGNTELERLIKDIHQALSTDPQISNVRWYTENDKMFNHGAEHPVE